MKLFDKFKRKQTIDLSNPIIVEVRYKNQLYPLTDTLLKFRRAFRWINFLIVALSIILFFALKRELWLIPITILSVWSGFMVMYGIFFLIILKKLFKIKRENMNKKENNDGKC